eukprot:3988723-Pyramimonas_sp.AAC.1
MGLLQALLELAGLAGPTRIHGPPVGPRLKISGALERPCRSRAFGGTTLGTLWRLEAIAGL